ncbi:MAG: Endoribonuclease [Pedosphaera sp.]|nr:Endoribonuclease [Pedosphaera sp.]
MKSKRLGIWGLIVVLAVQSTICQISHGEQKPKFIQCLESDKTTGSSKAVIVDDVPLAHTAQILPVNKKGEISGNAEAQIKQVMANVGEALKVADSTWEQVVKINVYVSRVEMVTKVEEACAQKFKGSRKPAVSFVMGNLTHTDALVAMDAIGTVTTGQNPQSVKRLGVHKTADAAVLPAGGKFYVSGQAKNDKLPEATRKTLESLEATLNFLGTGRSNVVQLKAFVQPISDKAVVESEIIKFFGSELAPPVVYVEWSSPTNTPIEIELIASEGTASKKGTDSVDFSTPPGMIPSKVYSKVAHVNHGKMIYLSGLYGKKSSDGAGQPREIFGTLGDVLKKTGSDFDHLVKATYYVSDNEASNKLNEFRPEFYNPERPPAASKAMVKGVGMMGKTITVDMIAVTK